MKKLILALALCVPVVAIAEARASFGIRINVAPSFNIVNQEPVVGGTIVTADTNMSEILLNGITIKLGRPGRQTFFVPNANGVQDGLSFVTR
jgi:hypothetical protein